MLTEKHSELPIKCSITVSTLIITTKKGTWSARQWYLPVMQAQHSASCSSEKIPGHSGLYSETLSLKTKIKRGKGRGCRV